MPINDAQKRYLRGLAHQLKPVIRVGQRGLTPAVLDEANTALARHELVKIHIAAGDREQRRQIIERMIDALGSELVQTIGNIAVVFRPNPKKKKPMVLPS